MHNDTESDLGATHGPFPPGRQKVRAADILSAGARHMNERAATYDKGGERSIPTAVVAFNAITGAALTAEQGWLFMALLKATRSQQGDYRADSYEDGAAYFALAGEQASGDRVSRKRESGL